MNTNPPPSPPMKPALDAQYCAAERRVQVCVPPAWRPRPLNRPVETSLLLINDEHTTVLSSDLVPLSPLVSLPVSRLPLCTDDCLRGSCEVSCRNVWLRPLPAIYGFYFKSDEGLAAARMRNPDSYSLAMARPSSIVDCTLVWGGCCCFLQHRRRDQQA